MEFLSLMNYDNYYQYDMCEYTLKSGKDSIHFSSVEINSVWCCYNSHKANYRDSTMSC